MCNATQQTPTRLRTNPIQRGAKKPQKPKSPRKGEFKSHMNDEDEQCKEALAQKVFHSQKMEDHGKKSLLECLLRQFEMDHNCADAANDPSVPLHHLCDHNQT